MNNFHRISWERHDVGSLDADSLLPLPMTVQYFVFGFARKSIYMA